ncbi:hypothetical protein ACFWUQ_02375 [Streptomyces sp. NPDC058662]|uniref:hypothetical protein n=1 Tax=Streptomyces sp. NPDC058662 TaxID=3346583 RepID=UPI003658DF64
MTKPAAAANTHAVNLEGFVKAYDYEPTGGENRIKRFNETINISHDAPNKTYSIEVCAGNEAVALLTVSLFLRKDEGVVVGSNIKLYEFDDCNHSDLERSHSPAPTVVRPGTQWTIRLSAHSREFQSPDHAEAAYYITNEKSAVDIGRPNEPSNVIVQAPALRGICAITRTNCKEKTVWVDWQDNANNETGYEIRNTTLNQTFGVGPNTTHFSFKNLAQIRHCFQVRAVGAAGPSDWTPVGTRVECA